ncbi:hypothetical protein [Isoptericola sp. NPDC019482]|uniref:hypothetical protein n=1 Tax=Isoptericola sp. NPDC019482 TaxID=3154688 RepID=UPI003484CFBA
MSEDEYLVEWVARQIRDLGEHVRSGQGDQRHADLLAAVAPAFVTDPEAFIRRDSDGLLGRILYWRVGVI